jgi:hypothetical protein
MLKSIFGAASLAALIAFNAPAHAATEYLTNGGFESGDFSGWTPSGDQSFNIVLDGSVFPYPYLSQPAAQGTFYALVGPIGADAGLSQTFSDTAGQTLTVSGYVSSDGSTPADVSFLFNGVALLSLDPLLEQPWTLYSFNVLATGSDTFEVRFRNDNSFSALDGFSVSSPVSAVPEPGTWVLLMAGFAALAFAGRMRSRQVATAFS